MCPICLLRTTTAAAPMPERQIRVLPGLPLLLVLLLLACPLPALSSERPVVGLALSGGGAKGMAHVGVLRVLEEMRVPVDVIAGTSAGAAVAALYASGMPVDEIEQRFIEMDWVSSFRDDPGRSYKPVRRKSMDWRYPVTPGLGVSADGIELGGGLVSGPHQHGRTTSQLGLAQRLQGPGYQRHR